MEQNRKIYRADIDGLRAIAVLSVIFFHLHIPLFSGGFIGVDVFFVISGYLITSILLREMNEGRFSIIRFYERRARRIAPALFLMTAVVLVAGYFLLVPADLWNLGKSAIATVFMLANIFWWKDTNYFSAPPDTKPLLHIWSLGVEEQFYLFWPPILWFILIKWKTARLPSLAVLTLTSLGLCIMVMQKSAMSGFFLVPFRAWELIIGGLLIFLPHSDKGPKWLPERLAFSGIAALIFPIFLLNEHSIFPGINAILPVIGSASIIWAGTGRQTTITRFLSYAPFVWIGLISYSLYLWHWPLIVYTRYWNIEALSFYNIMVILVMTFVIAILSYHFVEQPFRKTKQVTTKVVFSWTCAGTIMLALTGYIYSSTKGLPLRLNEDVLRYANATDDIGKYRKPCLSGDIPPRLDPMGKCHFGSPNKKIDAVLWGDSYAAAIADGLDEVMLEEGKSGLLIGTHACLPILDIGSAWQPTAAKCEYIQKHALDAIDNLKIKTVFLHGNWMMLQNPKIFQWLKVDNQIAFTQAVAASFAKTIEALRKRGVKIVIITSIPGYENSIPTILAHIKQIGKKPELYIPYETVLKNNQTAYEIFAKYRYDEDITFLNPTDVLCVNGQCRAEQNGHALYFDNHHLSSYGSHIVSEIFKQYWRNKFSLIKK